MLLLFVICLVIVIVILIFCSQSGNDAVTRSNLYYNIKTVIFITFIYELICRWPQ